MAGGPPLLHAAHAEYAHRDTGMQWQGCTRYRVPGTRYPPDLVLVLGQSVLGPGFGLWPQP